MTESVLFEKFYRYCELSKYAGDPDYPKGALITAGHYHYKVISRFFDMKTSTEGHLLQRLDRDNKFVLAFKHSEELKDWMCDLRFWKKRWPFSTCDDRNVKLHTGFVDSFASVRTKIMAELTLLLAGCQTKPVLTICGHSLGAALSSVAILDIKLNFGDRFDLSTYSYGSPRVFNYEGVQMFNETVDYAYRVIVGNDPIPHLPFGSYRNGGELFHLYGQGKFDRKEFTLFPFRGNLKHHYIESYGEYLKQLYVLTVGSTKEIALGNAD